MGPQKSRGGGGGSFAFEFNIDERPRVSGIPRNQCCNLGQPGYPVAIACFKLGNLLDGMEAHRASTIGGSIDSVIMNYDELLFASGVVYGMHIEFDALTSHVQSLAKAGQRIFGASPAVPRCPITKIKK